MSSGHQAWLALISIVSNLLGLVLPLALLQVYDRILPSGVYGTAVSLFIAVAVAMVLDGILRMTRARIVARASILREFQETVSLARDLLTSDIARLQAVDSGSGRGTFDAITQAWTMGGMGRLIALYDVPFAVIFTALVWFIGGWLAFIPFAILVICTGIAWTVSGWQRQAAVQRTQAQQATASRIADLLAGLIDLKGFGHAGRLMNDVDTAVLDHATHTELGERRDSLLTDWLQVASVAATVGIIVLGAGVVLAGGMTTGGLAACSVLGGRAVAAGLGVFSAFGRNAVGQAAGAQVKAMRQALGTPGMALPRTDAGDGEIVLTDVALRRPTLVFGPFSATIPTGVITRISGAHQSDELALMLIATGFEKPDAGSVAATGTTVFVPDRPTLFLGSILDNVTGWDPSRADAARALATALGLPPLIDRLAEGILTPVTGALTPSFSAGVIKRIALVRALAGDTGRIALQNPEIDLDIDGRRRLVDVLAQYRGTILLTTTDSALSALAANTVTLPMVSHPDRIAA